MTLRGDTAYHGVELTEINLGLCTGLMGLRHHDLNTRFTVLQSPGSHIARHRHLTHAGAVLGPEPLPNTPGGMTLLARSRFIALQPRIDDLDPGPDRRPRPRITLPPRRHRILQRLPDSAPVNLMPLGQRAHRQLLTAPIGPDRFEKSHSGSHLVRPP